MIETTPEAIYFHVRILLGMIVGLGLTHLLRHVARIVEHPRQRKIYWLHLVWALSVFLFLLHFWWWELRLAGVGHWTFNIYLFVALYALLLYLLCALVFPESLDDYASYRDYFYARRRWFFGVLIAVYLVDFADTWLKGPAYFQHFGTEYLVRNAAYIVAGAIAIATRNPWFHGAFAVGGLLYQLSWIVRQFETF